jgi:hypothetical protein
MAEEMLLAPTNKKSDSWRVALDEERAIFRPFEGLGVHAVRRDENADHLELVTFGKVAVLTVRTTKPKLQFKLTQEQRERFAAWLGPPTMNHLRVVLRQSYSLMLAIAVLYVLTSLPLPGDPEAGVEALALAPVGLGLGLAAFGLWAHARYHPRPYLFLLDVVWFLVLAADNAWAVSAGRISPWWLLTLLPVALVVNFRISQYAKFRHLPATAS